MEAGQLKEKLRKRTATHDASSASYTYWVTRDWVSLPRADQRQGRRYSAALRRVPTDLPLWTGIVHEGPRCTVDQVRSRQRSLMNRLRKFFANQNRSKEVALIFSVTHSTVRCRTGNLHLTVAGELLYHVHVHFIFQPPPGSQMELLANAFESTFGFNTFQPVNNRDAIFEYLTRPQDRADLLSHGELVAWHNQIKGLPRMRLYGEFRSLRYSLSTNRKTGSRRPRGYPAIRPYKPDKFVAKIRRGKRTFTLWENLETSPALVYEQAGVDRIPDSH
ncbi:MAG: hypothetical protein QOI49_2639 [Verrucomicrobiota bacterium]|jgi:hypothetical protein